MAAADDKKAREERLAAQLRENLRRRKAQAKAQATAQAGTSAKPEPTLHNDESSG